MCNSFNEQLMETINDNQSDIIDDFIFCAAMINRMIPETGEIDRILFYRNFIRQAVEEKLDDIEDGQRDLLAIEEDDIPF